MIDSLQQHPFLRLLIPLAIGILCGDTFPHAWPAWGYLLLSLLFVLMVCRYKRSDSLYGAVLFLFLVGTGYCLMSRQLEKTAFFFPEKEVAYKIRIQEIPEIKERSVLCRTVLLGSIAGDAVADCKRNNLFLIYFAKDSASTALQRGDELLIYTRLSPPLNNGNPDEFDYARYLKRKGYSGTAYVAGGHWTKTGHDASRSWSRMASDYRAKVVSLYRRLGIGGDELAVLSALTVGDREELSDDIVETYSVAGAAHVLALSGLHIGFLYALFRFLLGILWRRWKCLKFFLHLLIVLFLAGFAFFTGLSSSVVRAAVMFSFLALATMQHQKPLTMNTLAAAAFFMLLCKPSWLFDVGFQLSFSAVVSILLVQPKLYALWKVEHRFLRRVWGLLTVSVAAQLGTAPLTLLYFSRFSTHFLLTNLWVIPLVSLIVYSAVFLLMLTPFPFVQHLFAEVVEALVRMQNATLRWIEHLPFASIDGIWMDKWDVLLCFFFFGAVYYGSTHRTARNIRFSFFVLLLAVSYHSLSAICHVPRQSIAFYNVRGCPAVHCMTDSRHSWLVTPDSLSDVSRLYRALSPHWNRLHLESPCLVAGDYAASELQVRNGMVLYAGKRICFFRDADWQNKISAYPISVDYLYLSRGYKGRIEELVSLFSIATVVIDASLSDYYRDRIIHDCIRFGISYISLSTKGSYRILL